MLNSSIYIWRSPLFSSLQMLSSIPIRNKSLLSYPLAHLSIEDIANALQSCGKENTGVVSASSLHVFLCKHGLETHPFLGNYLVPMWVQVGNMDIAQQSFDKLIYQNEWSWNSLIHGYVKYGNNPQKALNLYDRMQTNNDGDGDGDDDISHIQPSSHTFVAILKACAKLKNSTLGIQIHHQVQQKKVFKDDLFIGNALIDMYCKCGLLTDAYQIFGQLQARSVISWTSLIYGCTHHGHDDMALACLERMQIEGLLIDHVTIICSLKACSNLKSRKKGQELHVKIKSQKVFYANLVVGNALIDMYIKCDSLERAKHVFNEIPNRDTVSWTTIIAGYVEHGYGKEALKFFVWMQVKGIMPDAATFVCTLKACSDVRDLEMGGHIHAEIERLGLMETNLAIGNTLVDMYAKCGCLAKANEIFIKLPVQDVVSWTAIIAGYVEHCQNDEALNCFEQMRIDGVKPNDVTFICSLKACALIGATEKGSQIHVEIERQGLLDRNIVVGTALVDMYCKWGVLTKALQVFDKLPVRDGVSWTVLMTGYAQLGESENVVSIFERMVSERVNPNSVTFLVLLSACCHCTSIFSKSKTYFEAMSQKFGIEPTLEHHTCMVNFLTRAGNFDKAISMIKKMPFSPDLVMWHALIGTCQHWGNIEFGRMAFKEVLRLDRHDTL